MLNYDELKQLFNIIKEYTYNNKNNETIKNNLDKLKEKFDEELNNFLINDKDFGQGKIIKEHILKINQVMYQYDEDDYNWLNSFDNTMCFYKDLIDLILI